MKKIALVGCGHIHTPAFVDKLNARSGSFVIAGVWDHDAARAAKNAERLHTAVYVSDSEIWADASIDAVVICSETNLHRDLVGKAVAAGKHLFVEKPLGFSGDEASCMADSIEKAGLLFQTGYFMRGTSIHQFLKQQIQNGAFGKITRIRHTNCHSGSLGGWFDTEWRWMANPEIAGCGAFGDLGTHSLDIMMWLVGKPERVTATIRTVTGRYGAQCDECGEALLLFPDGTIGSIAAGWVDVSNLVSCEICGTEGHAVVIQNQLFFQSSHVAGADGKTPWTVLPESQPHAFDLFLDAVEGKKVSLVSAREAADRNVVMSALYDANMERTWKNPAY